MMDFPDASRARRAGFWSTLRLGARMMMRDARAGELRLLVLALVVAVAAVTSVGFLADRVGRALERDAGQMLGPTWCWTPTSRCRTPSCSRRASAARGIAHLAVPVHGQRGRRRQLAALKAVEPGYPLRGALRVAEGPFAPDAPARGIPSEGAVWVDGQLLSLLSLKIGDLLNVGDTRLRIERVVSYEPDRGMQFVNVAPRVLLRASDLPATGLIAPGSRIGYALLVAGPPEAVSGYAGWLGQNLKRGQKLATLESGRPEVRRTLDRAQRFLSLVALLAVLISAVAVALAAGRMARHRDGIAVMRCLGAVQSQVSRMLTLEFALVGLFSSALGCLLGFAVHQGLVAVLASLIDTTLPAPSAVPAAQGLLTGLLLLLGFALPSLAQLRHAAGPRAAARRRHAGRAAPPATGWARRASLC